MSGELARMSRTFQDRIAEWVRARGYRGKNGTELNLNKELIGGRAVLFNIARNKMWKNVEWYPSLCLIDVEVHRIVNAAERAAGEAVPPDSIIFGNDVEFVGGRKRSTFPAIDQHTDLDRTLAEFSAIFEVAEPYFCSRVSTRADVLASLEDPEAAGRLCRITESIRQVKIAHMFLLNFDREEILRQLEIYDAEPDDWKSAGVTSPFTRFKKQFLAEYIRPPSDST